VTVRQIIKVLEGNGFILALQKGSHQIYKHRESGRIVPVPVHKGKTLKRGTVLGIIRQSGIDRHKFLKRSFSHVAACIMLGSLGGAD
jgi:predicted RNA binding protein YcfA (HicA-like mRNA interferase family)